MTMSTWDISLCTYSCNKCFPIVKVSSGHVCEHIGGKLSGDSFRPFEIVGGSVGIYARLMKIHAAERCVEYSGKIGK